MPKKSYANVLVFALALASWLGCSSSPTDSSVGSAKDKGGQLTVAVIPKCTSGEFWTTVEQGAKQAAADLDVNIRWEGTLGESEIAEQNRIIENMINLEVDGMAIAPLNRKATAKPVQGAIDAGIPVVIFDSGVDLDNHVSFVATNNQQCGALGAETMAEFLGGQGDVLVLRYLQGTASTEVRVAGFIEKAAALGLNIVGDPYPEDDSAAGAKKTAANTLEGFVKNSRLAIDGIFTCNLMTTLGVAAALDDLDKGGIEVKVKFIGFDTSPKLIQGVQDGTIDGLVVQASKHMGYLAVETLVKHLRGEQVESQIDTQVEIVTRERLENEAEIRELVGLKQQPDKWTMPQLRMNDVHKSFGATRALQGVNLAVEADEVHALVGENGAGKSTLMKVLSGALRPDRGEMRLRDEIYRPRNPLSAREAGVAMIYQELSLAPHLSVMENILLGIEPTKGPFVRWTDMKQRAAEALREVGIQNVRPETKVHRLSVAQQQLVEIARAAALQCSVLVLDEPTSSLTQKDIERLFALIRRLKAKNISVIYISHFLEEVQEISDRFTVLRDGETVGTGITAEAEVNDIIAMMVGRNVDDLYPRSTRTPSDVVLHFERLAGQETPTEATLELRRGEVVGIAGLMGSGRTELIRAIFGLDKVARGEITVMHYSGAAAPQQRWHQGVGLVSEDRKQEGLALGLSVADNITLSRLNGLGPGRFVIPSRQRQASRPWIDRIPIKCASAAQPISALSGGNQQKVALARLLHADVDILFLDEPTRGIDVGSKAQIYQLIDDLTAADDGDASKAKAVLMISSYLPELLGICDRIAVMCRGKLSEARPVDAWDEHALMVAATGQTRGG